MNTICRIAIDGNEANVTQRVGSNVYAFELLCALEKITQTRKDIVCCILLARPPLTELPAARDGWTYQVIGPRPFWTQWALPYHLYTHKNDYSLFFTPGHYAPRLCPIPFVSTVMDTAYLDFPDHFKPLDLLQLKHWTAYSVKHARKIIAISKATKYSVVARYHRRPEDVVVAYPALPPIGPSLNPLAKRDFLASRAITEPYIVFIGTLQPRKNLPTLVSAFELLCQILRLRRGKTQAKNAPVAGELPSLVIAGKVGWLAEQTLQRIARSSERDRIILTGFISESEKRALLERASCLVLVGLHEGFGIPPLEALAFGTPVVVANTSSLPEVVGTAGVMIPPQKPAVLARALEKLLALTPAQKRELQKKGREQAEKFSWEKTAKIVLHTLVSEATKHTP